MKKGDKDITIMQIIVEGKKDGYSLRYTYDLFDKYDDKTNTTSMSRCTAFTAAMMVRAIAYKKFIRIGISPPEIVGLN